MIRVHQGKEKGDAPSSKKPAIDAGIFLMTGFRCAGEVASAYSAFTII